MNNVALNVIIFHAAPPQNTRVTSEPFPPVAYEGSRFSLRCRVAVGSHLSYTWFFNRTEVKPSSLFSPRGDELVIEKVSQQHAGYYSCLAWSMVQDTKRYSSSTMVQLTVKGECQRSPNTVQSQTCWLSASSFEYTLNREGLFV